MENDVKKRLNLDDEILKKIEKEAVSYTTLMAYYRCAIMEVETKFNVLNEELSIRYDRNPIETVKSRLKKPRSIGEKLERLGIEVSVQNIEKHLNDVAGIRVICSFPEDVYMLADALLKQDDIRLIAKKDYIQNPKPNGYRSLHLIIGIPIFLAKEKREMKVEIQLRTIAMDFWASLEHRLNYKKEGCLTEFMHKELLECAQMSADLDKRMQNLRNMVEKDSN